MKRAVRILGRVLDPYNLGRAVGILLGLAFGIGLVPVAIALTVLYGFALLAWGGIRRAIGRRDRRTIARARAKRLHPSATDLDDLFADVADIPFDLLRLHDNDKESL